MRHSLQPEMDSDEYAVPDVTAEQVEAMMHAHLMPKAELDAHRREALVLISL